jgi:hypothetical protein
LLVDEVEAGLEPFRLRHLLRILQEFANGEPAGPALTKGQVLLTTHSPVVIEELDARSVHVVRRDSEGVVEIRKVPEQLQDVLRAVPESFLGRRIVVCEGKTELGLACAVEGQWSSKHGGRSLAHAGAVLTLGNGQQTGSRAQAFSTLGFPVSVLADSDNPLDPSAEALSADGIAVFLWADGVASETRLSIDLPWDGFLELYRLAEGHRSSQSIRDAVSSRFETPPSTGEEPQSWADGGLEEDRIRTAFAEAAIKGAWFKRVDYGIEIGELVVRYWDDMLESNLVDTLSALADWIYDDDWT